MENHETSGPALSLPSGLVDDTAHRFPADVVGHFVSRPVHTVYGGAHIFNSGTVSKLRSLAMASLDEFAPDAGSFADCLGLSPTISETVYEKVRTKLAADPVEDLRVDFEDGYGLRGNDEEDRHALAAGRETRTAMDAGAVPTFFGIRVKALTSATARRALRTLDIYLTELAAPDGKIPENFVVTLPKVVEPIQVTLLTDTVCQLESLLGMRPGSIGIELMVETPRSIYTANGVLALPSLIAAAGGRCRALHFGAYDYTASLGIISAEQSLHHPSCDTARSIMQLAVSGTAVGLSDGATNQMPIGPNRGPEISDIQRAVNAKVVHAAWRRHFDDCSRSLSNGFYQGWDLHPAQLPTRYAAIYSFFLENAAVAAGRLRNFVDRAARSTLSGDVFDDAATGQGLLNYFIRGVGCGAFDECEASKLCGLTMDELRSRSFEYILNSKRKEQ